MGAGFGLTPGGGFAFGCWASAAATQAVATLAPLRVRLSEQAEWVTGFRQKRLAVRHVSNDRVVAIVEIVSPGNKSGGTEFKRFVGKAVRAVRADVNVLILDSWPPTPRDPNGIHGAIWPKLGGKAYTAPADRPLTFAAYEDRNWGRAATSNRAWSGNPCRRCRCS